MAAAEQQRQRDLRHPVVQRALLLRRQEGPIPESAHPFIGCSVPGDTRVNQNPQLTLLQVVLLREHNRLADALAVLNPHWDDETIFQEARKIAIAEHQYISYYEWLPLFLGVQNTLKNRIIYNTKDFVNDYQSSVNPTVLNEHATAAFRYFHSLIAGHLEYVCWSSAILVL